MGASLIATKGWTVPEVETTYARARELCRGEDQNPKLLAAMFGLFLYQLHRSSKRVALQIAGELLGVAERQQDVGAQCVGHRSMAVSLLFHGQLLPALTHIEQSLALYDRTDRSSPLYLAGPNTRVACLLFKSLILLLQGYLDQALVCSREALAAAYQLDHAFTTSQALYLTSWFHQVRGEPRVVEERARALMELTTERGLSAWLADGTVLHGWAVAAGGDTDRGIAQLRQGLAAKEAIGVQQHTPGFLGLLAELQLGIGNAREALDVLDMALVRVDRLEERWFEARLLRLKGEALLGLSSERIAEAQACYEQALAVARTQGAHLWELRAAMSMARLWRDRGKRAQAHDLLAAVYDWFTEGFDTIDLKEAKALLDELA